MDDSAKDLARKVDSVIGEYRDGPRDRAERWRGIVLTWGVAALLAVIAAATIVLIIESHRLPKEVPKREPKPVPVQILPAKPAGASG
jgi:hypothetical protein